MPDTKPTAKRPWLGVVAWIACLALGGYQGYRAHEWHDKADQAAGAWLAQSEQFGAMADEIVEMRGALRHSDGATVYWQQVATVQGTRWLQCDTQVKAMQEACLRRAGF